MQNDLASPLVEDEIDLKEIAVALWRGKTIIIAIVSVCAILAVTVALLIPNQYKATAAVAPAQSSSSSALGAMASRLGGLATLAGINVGSGDNVTEAQTAIEIMQSWQFIETFVQSHNLQAAIFAADGWDSQTNQITLKSDIYDSERDEWIRKPPSGKTAQPTSWELYQEFSNRLSVSTDFLTPLLRLFLKFVVFGFFYWQFPEAIPESIGMPLLDSAFGVPAFAWCVSVLFCVGFINAFNMADGANCLIPGIAGIWAVIFYLENGLPIEAVLLFCIAIFLIVNVISGWFFLGDAGSYGIGALVALTGLRGVADGDFTAWFMASLLVYPCVDFVVSILRRLRQRRSPFMPDNDHLHNWLHRYFSSRIRSQVMANSLTGLSISMGTSGLVFLIYIQGWLAITSHQWLYLFGAQCLAYAVLRRALNQTGYSR